MSVLTDIVLAKASEAEAVLLQYPQPTWPHIDVKGLDTLQLGDLYALLLQDPEMDPQDLAEEFQPMESAEGDLEEGPWVFPWPERFTALLAALPPSRVPEIVAQWLASDEPPDWPADALQTLLRELPPLAQQAQASQTHPEPLQLLLWISL